MAVAWCDNCWWCKDPKTKTAFLGHKTNTINLWIQPSAWIVVCETESMSSFQEAPVFQIALVDNRHSAKPVVSLLPESYAFGLRVMAFKLKAKVIFTLHKDLAPPVCLKASEILLLLLVLHRACNEAHNRQLVSQLRRELGWGCGHIHPFLSTRARTQVHKPVLPFAC